MMYYIIYQMNINKTHHVDLRCKQDFIKNMMDFIENKIKFQKSQDVIYYT